MKRKKTAVQIISWLFFMLILGLALIGLNSISGDISLNFSMGGYDMKGSKYFIFMYPLISLVLACSSLRGRNGNREEKVLNRKIATVILVNSALLGFLIYTILIS